MSSAMQQEKLKNPQSTPGPAADPGTLQQELTRARLEVERLKKNRIALFDVMLDMVFLIRDDYVIEYMNASAIRTFGDQCGRICHQALEGRHDPCPNCPVTISSAGKAAEGLFERKLGQIYVEYNYVSFQGYRNDQLVMIVMRDITARKQQEAELAQMHNDIETVLQQKIQALRESERVRQELSQEVNILKQELDRHCQQQDGMVGSSRRIQELRELTSHVADSEATILITGESGTGKELVADIIHKRSQRHNKPLFKFNCAAVSENLLESELFGYEKGAFTGATSRHRGKFETANGGTIFLDEIGDISPRMQAALLRVLQNGEIVRVGGNETIKTDARIIAATNVNLGAAVEEGRFRRDLYYRLNVINIHLPPLRERREDIVPLVTHFVTKYRAAFQKNIDYLPNGIMDRLLQHNWPGNIRELENVIKRAILLARNNIITEKEVSFESHEDGPAQDNAVPILENWMLEQPLKETLAKLEGKIMASALKQYQYNPQVVAKVLKLGKTTLYEKMKRHGLTDNGNRQNRH